MLSEAMLLDVRRRRFPLIGDGGGWWSFINVDDAATATLGAVEKGGVGLYNIVDDDPAPVSEWLPALASMLGAKPPLHVPKLLARIIAGAHLVVMTTEARADSNAKAKRELSWRLAHPFWQEGFREILSQAH
jgi:nucleoside-diphosphate-sugar epimerase